MQALACNEVKIVSFTLFGSDGALQDEPDKPLVSRKKRNGRFVSRLLHIDTVDLENKQTLFILLVQVTFFFVQNRITSESVMKIKLTNSNEVKFR